MAEIFDKFPGKKGLLKNPVIVENTNGNIEIIREFDGSNISVGLFDFDGTLSDERVGWPNLMVATNSAFFMSYTENKLSHKEAEKSVIEDIEKTIGIPTYMQMKRLVAMIEKSGHNGANLDPKLFKDVYNNSLVSMVESRRQQIKSGEISMEDLRIKGSVELLEELSKMLTDGIYLATGSDVDAIKESVDYLGFSKFFPKDRIAGAGSLGPEDDAKEAVIKKMLTEYSIKGNQLLTFGDGFPEILHTHLAGGIAVGVLTRDHSYYEHLGHFTIEQKEQRLRNAGAHIIVRNPYQNIPELVKIIKEGYSESNE